MKKTIKHLLSCIIVCAMLITVLSGATEIAEKKSSANKYAPFFEHAKDIDVLFLGSSHMLNAVYPLELWNRYGITSYNMGAPSCQLAVSYWNLMNALDYCTPKAVVVDCLFISDWQKVSANFSYQHESFDAFPLSLTKIRAAFDLLDSPKDEANVKDAEENGDTASEKPTILGLLWNYSVYHSRWTELSKEDFVKESSLEYGANSRVRVAQPKQTIENEGGTFSEDKTGRKYLRKIIEECKKRDIDIILAYLPYPITVQSMWREVNTAQEVADDYGIDYINFLEGDIVDFNVDCFDERSHVNVSGGLKVTNYLGSFLTEKYALPDHRGDPEYSYWDEDFSVYKGVKDERLSTVKDLNTFLMLLKDKDYDFVLGIGDPRIFEDETTVSLLRNRGVNVDEVGEGTKYIVVQGDDSRVIDSDEANRNNEEPAPSDPDDGSDAMVQSDIDHLISDNSEWYQEEKILANVYNSDGTGLVNTSVFAIPAGSTATDTIPKEDGAALTSRAVRVD